MFPIFLNLSGRRIVVVGGGPTGRRWARAVLAGGGAVRVVTPEPPPPDAPPAAEWRAEPYHPDHLTGAFLVLAAGPPAVNATVLADARERGVWAASATDPAAGDFVLPAVGRREGLTVAVGTGGAAPILARKVRDKILSELDGTFTHWIAILGQLRPAVRAAVPDPAARRRLFTRLTDDEWADRLRRDGPDVVRAAMWEEIRRASE